MYMRNTKLQTIRRGWFGSCALSLSTISNGTNGVNTHNKVKSSSIYMSKAQKKRIKGYSVISADQKQSDVDNYLRSLSVRDLKDLQNIYLNNSHATIRAMIKGTRYMMKNDRLGDVELTGKSSRTTRYPIGLDRNSRVSMDNGDMEITFLGTASSSPTLSRGVSCTALKYKSEMFLFDCGESSQLQFKYSDLGTGKINKIFITHMHGDHVFGLPAILCGIGSIQLCRVQDENVLEEDLQGFVVDIYGPEGIREYIRSTLFLSKSKTIVPYRIHELKNIPMVSPFQRKNSASNVSPSSSNSTSKGGKGGSVVVVPKPTDVNLRQFDAEYFNEVEGSTDIYPDENGIYHILENNELSIKAAPLSHSIPCVGYVVDEKPRVGTLRIDKIQHLLEVNEEALKEQHGRHFRKIIQTIKQLKPEESFVFPNGDIIYGRDVVTPDIEGRKVVVLGDTCNSERIVPIAMNADVLIHEATCIPKPGLALSLHDEVADAISRRHSSPRMAGQFAERINAKQLLLTHFAGRCSGHHDEKSMKAMWAVEDMARKSAPKLVGGNDIIAAWDFMTIRVPNKNYGREYLEKKESSEQ